MEGWPAACTWERGALAAVGRHFWGGGIFSVKGFSLGKLLGREGSLLVPGIFESEGWRVRENFREIFQLRLWLHFWRERAFLCRGEGFLVFLEKGSSSGKKGQRVFFLRVGCIFGCHFWEILEGVKKDRGGLSWVRVFFSISGFKDILEGFEGRTFDWCGRIFWEQSLRKPGSKQGSKFSFSFSSSTSIKMCCYWPLDDVLFLFFIVVITSIASACAQNWF